MKPIVAAALLFFPCILTAEENHLDEAFVAQKCAAEWGTDYNMVEFCVNQIGRSHIQFVLFELEVIAQTDYFLPSFQRCKDEWGQDWNMVDFCARQQYNSLFELMESVKTLPEPTDGIVLQSCTDEWQPDITMMAFCADQQAQSWLRLNGG